MKLKSTHFFTSAFLILFLFNACSSVDADPTIEGTWAVQSLELEVVTLDFDTKEVYNTTPCNYDAHSPNQNVNEYSRLIVNADHTGSINFSGDCVETFEFDFEWTFELGREFTMDRVDGIPTTWYAVQLTHDSVILQFTREHWNRNVIPRLITRRQYNLELSRIE